MRLMFIRSTVRDLSIQFLLDPLLHTYYVHTYIVSYNTYSCLHACHISLHPVLIHRVIVMNSEAAACSSQNMYTADHI
jgi:hypothetical protein